MSQVKSTTVNFSQPRLPNDSIVRWVFKLSLGLFRTDSITKLANCQWQELESTSRVAMATIQSNTGSLHSLQQTLISQKRELSELRKLLRIRNESLEGSTEIEYLRNILFEYMMGRETLVLTRVISAVVKFDQEQTTKVLKKEEDKLTLVGSTRDSISPIVTILLQVYNNTTPHVSISFQLGSLGLL